MFPISTTRGQNRSTGSGEMVPVPKELEAKLGTYPVFKKAGCRPEKVQVTRAEQSPGWVGPGCGRTRNALLKWHLTTADGTEGDPQGPGIASNETVEGVAATKEKSLSLETQDFCWGGGGGSGESSKGRKFSKGNSQESWRGSRSKYRQSVGVTFLGSEEILLSR